MTLGCVLGSIIGVAEIEKKICVRVDIQIPFLRTFLTLYQTIPTFNDPKEKASEKEKMLVTIIFHFPTIFSTLSKTELITVPTFNFSSANTFRSIWK